MKSTLQAYQRNHEYERLAKALSDLSSHAPEGYERWKELSARGVLAAQAKDDPTLRQVCKDCHNTHRARYRSERRASALW